MAEKKLTAKLGLDDSEFKRKLKDANGGVTQFAGKLSALGTVIGVGGIAAAFTVIKKGIESSGDASDRLGFKISGLQGAFSALAQNVISLDFSRSLTDAYEAAHDLAEAMDDIQDQTLSISILDSQNAVKIAQLRNDLRDVDLTTGERLAKEAEIKTIIQDELAARKRITDQQLAAVNASNAVKYGISTEEANLYLEYLTNYSKLTDEQRTQLSLAMQLNKAQLEQKRNSGDLGQLDLKRSATLKDIQAAAAALPPELRKYLALDKIIYDYTDKQKEELAKIIIGYNNANASLLRQEGMVDRIGDRLSNQAEKTEVIADNVRKAADAYAVWNDQIRVNANQPALPGSPADPSKLTIKSKDLTSSIAKNSIDAETAINRLGSSFDRLGGSIDGAAGSWLSYIGGLISAIPDAITAITAMTTAQKAQSSANASSAATGAAASVASIPIVGPALAISAIASVMAALLSLPKLADGGIAYGPTTALIGEYAGASSNPEVIAPLNKLKNIMGGDRNINVIVRGKIKGRDVHLSGQRYSETLNNKT